MVKCFMAFFGVALSMHVQALPCFVTMVKDSCWLGYDVTVDVLDADKGTVISTIIVPQGKAWARQAFTCHGSETLAFSAKFTPAFWKGEEDRVYPAQHYWKLPKEMSKKESAWNITICYPKSFSEVPLPPDATGHCACDLKAIPPVELQ